VLLRGRLRCARRNRCRRRRRRGPRAPRRRTPGQSPHHSFPLPAPRAALLSLAARPAAARASGRASPESSLPPPPSGCSGSARPSSLCPHLRRAASFAAAVRGEQPSPLPTPLRAAPPPDLDRPRRRQGAPPRPAPPRLLSCPGPPRETLPRRTAAANEVWPEHLSPNGPLKTLTHSHVLLLTAAPTPLRQRAPERAAMRRLLAPLVERLLAGFPPIPPRTGRTHMSPLPVQIGRTCLPSPVHPTAPPATRTPRRRDASRFLPPKQRAQFIATVVNERNSCLFGRRAARVPSLRRGRRGRRGAPPRSGARRRHAPGAPPCHEGRGVSG